MDKSHYGKHEAVNKTTPKIIAVGLTGALLVVAMAPFGAKDDPKETTNKPQRSESTGKDTSGLVFETIEGLVNSVDAEQRRALLADPLVFARFVEQAVDTESVIKAARGEALHKDARVKLLVDRAVNQVLIDAYLERALQGVVDDGYPSEDDARAYYERHKQLFEIPERMHVWQIYFPMRVGMDAEEIATLARKAKQIADAAGKDPKAFERLAAKHSQHLPSRGNGGYMGLLPLKELIPEISKSLMVLSEDEVGQPINARDGLHILKRGSRVSDRIPEFTEVREQVRAVMRNERIAEARERLLKKVREDYRVEVRAEQLQQWREKLGKQTPEPSKNNLAATAR